MINFFYTDEYLNHDTGQHPESIERIKTVKKLIFEKYSNHNILTPTLASKELIYNVHDKNYVDYIFDNIPATGYSFFDPDTVACPQSLNSYLYAVGGSVESVDQIISNHNNKVFFCAHRPPGHHAEMNKAMGFGVFNNVAISADYALRSQRFKKILIIDFDVHH